MWRIINGHCEKRSSRELVSPCSLSMRVSDGRESVWKWESVRWKMEKKMKTERKEGRSGDALWGYWLHVRPKSRNCSYFPEAGLKCKQDHIIFCRYNLVFNSSRREIIFPKLLMLFRLYSYVYQVGNEEIEKKYRQTTTSATETARKQRREVFYQKNKSVCIPFSRLCNNTRWCWINKIRIWRA